MGVISVILLVAFVIVCVLLICVVLVQNEEGDGMGGLFGGNSSQAFGARSGNVLTKTTYILVTLFFLASFGLALMNKTPTVKSLVPAQAESKESTESWIDAEESADEVAPAEVKSTVAE